jgi:hypothetical protein
LKDSFNKLDSQKKGSSGSGCTPDSSPQRCNVLIHFWLTLNSYHTFNLLYQGIYLRKWMKGNEWMNLSFIQKGIHDMAFVVISLPHWLVRRQERLQYTMSSSTCLYVASWLWTNFSDLSRISDRCVSINCSNSKIMTFPVLTIYFVLYFTWLSTSTHRSISNCIYKYEAVRQLWHFINYAEFVIERTIPRLTSSII